MGNQKMCTARVVFCLADGLGLFAVRFPSLSRRMECGDSGITFDIFTHVSMHKGTQVVCLGDRYNVAHLQRKNDIDNKF